jgi:hypothetical protein
MDALAPIPPPQNPITTLAGIMGIKQQQQALQTGQYNQATAQAESQQAQQKNAELQAVGNLTKNAYNPRYSNADGSFDNQAFADDVARVAPTYGQAIAKDATMRAGELYQNQQTLFNLNQSERSMIGDAFGSWATDDKLNHSRFINNVENLREQFPNNPGVSRMLTSMATAMPSDADGLHKGLQQAAIMAKSPTAELSMPGQGTNAAGQNQLINKVTGARSVPQLGPGAINPTSSQVAGATAAATLPYVKPTAAASASGAAEGTAQTANLTGVAGRVQQAQAAANNTVGSIDALNRAKSILESPGAPSTGTQYESVKSLKNLMSSLGIDTSGADDMNTLTKNLARYEATRATQAGLGGTDAARELAHSGSPNTQLDNKALLGIVRQSLATEQAVGSYANVQSKATSPQQMLQNENAFRNIPNHIQAREYGMMRTPQEADAYLKAQGMSKADMAAARAKVKEFDSQ